VSDHVTWTENSAGCVEISVPGDGK